jgi:hypothetical protein
MQNTTFSKSMSKLALLIVLFFTSISFSQNKTFPSGSLIVNMGIVPQTIGNALKPYGMIYSLISNQGVPVNWIIDNTKLKDGTDFTYNGYDFKGGPFVISAEYLIPAVTAEIAKWTSQGVVTVITTSPITVPVFKQIIVSAIPRWTLDKQNGSIAQVFFTNAGIPPSAYGGATSATWKTPAQLTECDDIFVMPHADPTWATHSNLKTWNQVHKGSIWLGCHAGSALEDMFNPANPSEQTNFLSEKTGNASGAGPYFENALTLWGNHTNGTPSPPYIYEYGGDPVMQFMGTIDAATLNGSEQIYIPRLAGWRPTTSVSCYDSDHPQILSTAPKHRASVIAYGPGYGNTDNGSVMIEASHSVAKASLPSNIAGQRAFFNFSILAARQKSPDPEVSLVIGTVSSGSTVPLSFTVASSYTTNDFNVVWSSSCGGTFSTPTLATTNFTAPQVNAPTNCTITITLTSKSVCAQVFKNSTSALIVCALTVSSTVSPACFGLTNGKINIDNIVGGVPNYNWSWTKAGGGTGSGTSATYPFSITNLAPGNYTVSILALNGTGCGTTFSTSINENLALSATSTPTNLSCNGAANGAIDLAISGGSPGYTYAWTASAGGTIPSGQASNKNLNGLTAGTYSVTVTDSKGCTATTSQIISESGAITITPTITNVSCRGNNSGAIALAIVGGSSPYTYLWNDGNTSQDRTGLAAGTYSVILTDAGGCTKTQGAINVTQPAAILSLSETHTNVLVNGDSTGAIDLTVTGGTSTYTFVWTGVGVAVFSEDQTGLAAGAYNVTVTDANSCTATLSVTLTQPALMTLSTTLTNAICPPGAQTNGNTGAIDLSVSGGVPSYTYDWTDIGSPGVFTDSQDRTGIPAGTYTVVVKDTNGATKTTTVTLTNLNPNPATPASINH